MFLKAQRIWNAWWGGQVLWVMPVWVKGTRSQCLSYWGSFHWEEQALENVNSLCVCVYKHMFAGVPVAEADKRCYDAVGTEGLAPSLGAVFGIQDTSKRSVWVVLLPKVCLLKLVFFSTAVLNWTESRNLHAKVETETLRKQCLTLQRCSYITVPCFLKLLNYWSSYF